MVNTIAVTGLIETYAKVSGAAFIELLETIVQVSKHLNVWTLMFPLVLNSRRSE